MTQAILEPSMEDSRLDAIDVIREWATLQCSPLRMFQHPSERSGTSSLPLRIVCHARVCDTPGYFAAKRCLLGVYGYGTGELAHPGCATIVHAFRGRLADSMRDRPILWPLGGLVDETTPTTAALIEARYAAEILGLTTQALSMRASRGGIPPEQFMRERWQGDRTGRLWLRIGWVLDERLRKQWERRRKK